MIRKDKILSRRKPEAFIAAAVAAIAIGGGAYGIVGAIASTGQITDSTKTGADHRGVHGKGGPLCVSSARWDLRGGPPATAVPTVITKRLIWQVTVPRAVAAWRVGWCVNAVAS